MAASNTRKTNRRQPVRAGKAATNRLRLYLQSHRRRLFCHEQNRRRMLRMLQEVWQHYADHPTPAGGAAVQVNFVNTETICRLHAEYFGDPTETDVITFPLQGPGLAGEIYICTDRAISQARQYGISVDEELARLAVHGVLHLLGFDDLHPGARRRMRELERRYLKMFSLLQRKKKSG